MSSPPPPKDTQIGGARRDFPSTCWSRFASGADPERAAADLARHYWKPIYAFVRRRWKRSSEDAKDLTQEFFAWMIESGFLAKADRSRGRFRFFVKTALDHFVVNEARDAARLKRGGGRGFFALEGDVDESSLPADAKQRTPEELLDDDWRNGLLTRAAATLEETLTREGRATGWKIFHAYCLDSENVDYRGLAARHGIAEGEVLVELRHARRRFRSILSDLVAETVQGPEELAEEFRALFGEDTP